MARPTPKRIVQLFHCQAVHLSAYSALLPPLLTSLRFSLPSSLSLFFCVCLAEQMNLVSRLVGRGGGFLGRCSTSSQLAQAAYVRYLKGEKAARREGGKAARQRLELITSELCFQLVGIYVHVPCGGLSVCVCVPRTLYASLALLLNHVLLPLLSLFLSLSLCSPPTKCNRATVHRQSRYNWCQKCWHRWQVSGCHMPMWSHLSWKPMRIC